MTAYSSTDTNPSYRNVQIQMLKTAVIVALLLFLGFNQYAFLVRAISAHPELNLMIIGVFVFGAAIALRSMFNLFQEDRALRAMKQTWTDFEVMEREGDQAGVQRLLRTSERAVVFKHPRIFGQVYDLIIAELMKTRALRVSLAQRVSMMGMVSESMHREKSLVQYITGVMILLGLIGTFIGLMEMVSSVGGIIGGLARAGSGSDEAIKSVIKDLEAPLTGMATGFSASLFGLLGSLVLGLIARFGQSAAQGLKHDFENWLSKVSRLEQQNAAHHDAAIGGGSDGQVVALAGSLLTAFRTTQGLINRSGEVMRKLADRQDTQTTALNQLCEQVENLAARQARTIQQMKRLDSIGDAVDSIRQDAILRDRASANRLAESVGRITQSIETAHTDVTETLFGMSEQQRVTERMTRALEAQTTRGFEDISLQLSGVNANADEQQRITIEHQAELEKLVRASARPLDARTIADQLGAAVDERLAAGFGAVAGAFDHALGQLSVSLDGFGAAQVDLAGRLSQIGSNLGGIAELRDMGRSIENGLNGGLSEIAKVLDSVIAQQAKALTSEAPAKLAEAAPVSPKESATGARSPEDLYGEVFDRFKAKTPSRNPSTH